MSIGEQIVALLGAIHKQQTAMEKVRLHASKIAALNEAFCTAVDEFELQVRWLKAKWNREDKAKCLPKKKRAKKR